MPALQRVPNPDTRGVVACSLPRERLQYPEGRQVNSCQYPRFLPGDELLSLGKRNVARKKTGGGSHRSCMAAAAAAMLW